MSESTWQSTPPTDTLTTLQRAVAGYVLMPTDDEVLDTASLGIRRAIDRLNTRTWNWNLVYQDITFVAGTQEYTLQNQFKAPRNLELRRTDGTPYARLVFQPWGTFLKESNYNGTSSNPECYTINNDNIYGTLRLDASPASSFVAQYPTGRLWYYKRVPYPETSNNSLNVPSEAVQYIQYAAEGLTADRYAPEKAQPAYMRAERAYRDLIADDCHGRQSDWE